MRPHMFLRPGEYVVSASPTEVVTVLGSCVSVCLWNPVRGYGAMNHFVLPIGDPRASDSSWRYGDSAVDGLVHKLLELGARRGELRAKLFGGGHLLASRSNDDRRLGARNVAIARERLASHQLDVEAQAVGGDYGRKVFFHTDTGNAWVQALGRETPKAP
jgi:chemotaxis protein CheD